MKFVVNKPALIIGKKLVIADLHLGLEFGIRGFNINDQTGKLIAETIALLTDNKCDELIIVGDLKDSIRVNPGIEQARKFVNAVKKYAKITLVQGNHDGALQEYLDITVTDGKGYRDGDYYFMHGHAEPKKEARNCTIISSHLHPVIEFRDPLGGRMIEKVWLRSEKNVIMPAFNPLLGGTDIRNSSFGVIRNYVNVDELDIYLTDGLYLGRVKDLPVLENGNKTGYSRKKGSEADKGKNERAGRPRRSGSVPRDSGKKSKPRKGVD